MNIPKYLSNTETDFQTYFNSIRSLIEKKYCLTVTTQPLIDDRTGEFNGRFINIDSSQDVEEQLFLLLHLFGHSIQWAVSDYWRELGLKQPGFDEFDDYRFELLKRIDEIYEYEEEASSYGMALLHEAKIYCLDQWLSDWFHADWKFLHRVYKNGFKKEYLQDFKGQYFEYFTEIINPKSIPIFELAEWDYRFAF